MTSDIYYSIVDHMISLKENVLNIEEYLNLLTMDAVKLSKLNDGTIDISTKENRQLRCRSQRWKLKAIPIICLNKEGWEETLLRINHYKDTLEVNNVKKYNFIEDEEEEM